MAAAGAFLAGAAFGGIRYGYLKFHLYERESVVHYSADSVKAHFHGEKVGPRTVCVCGNGTR